MQGVFVVFAGVQVCAATGDAGEVGDGFGFVRGQVVCGVRVDARAPGVAGAFAESLASLGATLPHVFAAVASAGFQRLTVQVQGGAPHAQVHSSAFLRPVVDAMPGVSVVVPAALVVGLVAPFLLAHGGAGADGEDLAGVHGAAQHLLDVFLADAVGSPGGEAVGAVAAVSEGGDLMVVRGGVVLVGEVHIDDVVALVGAVVPQGVAVAVHDVELKVGVERPAVLEADLVVGDGGRGNRQGQRQDGGECGDAAV